MEHEAETGMAADETRQVAEGVGAEKTGLMLIDSASGGIYLLNSSPGHIKPFPCAACIVRIFDASVIFTIRS